MKLYGLPEMDEGDLQERQRLCLNDLRICQARSSHLYDGDIAADLAQLETLSIDDEDADRIIGRVESRLQNVDETIDRLRSFTIARTIPGNVPEKMRMDVERMMHSIGRPHAQVLLYERLPDGFSFHESSPEIRRHLLEVLEQQEIF